MQIKVNNVTYLYNKKEPVESAALKKASLTINENDFVTIVGKTGSGKSTLVQTLNALILPTFGYNEVEEFYITEDKKLKKILNLIRIFFFITYSSFITSWAYPSSVV